MPTISRHHSVMLIFEIRQRKRRDAEKSEKKRNGKKKEKQHNGKSVSRHFLAAQPPTKMEKILKK